MQRSILTYHDIGCPGVVVLADEEESFYDFEKLISFISICGESDEIYLYLGSIRVHWKAEIIERVLACANDLKVVTHLVACECDWDQKKCLAERYKVGLIDSECTGYVTLPRIARSLIA